LPEYQMGGTDDPVTLLKMTAASLRASPHLKLTIRSVFPGLPVNVIARLLIDAIDLIIEHLETFYNDEN